VPINRLLLPPKLDSLDDLRLASAQVQADIVLVYTLDTSFRIQGRGYGPLAAISLGVVPDRDAYITSTASALFIDVRTGFIYSVAESTAKASGLTAPSPARPASSDEPLWVKNLGLCPDLARRASQPSARFGNVL
jgi:hypothetical protein